MTKKNSLSSSYKRAVLGGAIWLTKPVCRATAVLLLVSLSLLTAHGAFDSIRFFPDGLRFWIDLRRIYVPDWAALLVFLALSTSLLIYFECGVRFETTPPSQVPVTFQDVRGWKRLRPYLFAVAIVLVSTWIAQKAQIGAMGRFLIWASALCLAGSFFERGPGNDRNTHSPGRAAFLLQSLIICALHLALWVPRLSSWRMAAIGDEYGFLVFPRTILGNAGLNIFSPDGYFHFPVLGSVAQGILIEMLGGSMEAFRLSGLLAVTATIPGLMMLANSLFGPRYGWWAGFFLAVDLLSSSIGSIGYNNSQMIPVMIWSMALAVRATQTKSPRCACFAGIIAGFGFYTVYIGMAAVAIAMPLLWPGILGAAKDKKAYLLLRLLVPYGCGFVMSAFPMLLVIHTQLRLMFRRAPSSLDAEMFLRNGFHTLMSPVTFHSGSHYLHGDIFISTVSVFALIGIFSSVLNCKRPRVLYLIVTFLAAVIASGVLCPYNYPSVTRILLISPWIAVFSGIGVVATAQTFDAARISRVAYHLLSAILILLSLLDWNILNRKTCARFAYLSIAQVVKVAGRFGGSTIDYVFPDRAHQEGPRFVLNLYGLLDRVNPRNETAFLGAMDTSFNPRPTDFLIVHGDAPKWDVIRAEVKRRCVQIGCADQPVQEVRTRDGKLKIMAFSPLTSEQIENVISQSCESFFTDK